MTTTIPFDFTNENKKRLLVSPKPIDVFITPKDIKRFLKSVKITVSKKGTFHWIWTKYKDRKGYGQFKLKGKAYWAHRVAFVIFKGQIPEALTVNHKSHCLNPSCVNPDCLN